MFDSVLAVIDWNPLVSAVAILIIAIAPSTALWIKVQATGKKVGAKVDAVKTLVNGNQDQLADRVAVLERALIKGSVTVVHAEDRRVDTPSLSTPDTGAH